MIQSSQGTQLLGSFYRKSKWFDPKSAQISSTKYVSHFGFHMVRQVVTEMCKSPTPLLLDTHPPQRLRTIQNFEHVF